MGRPLLLGEAPARDDLAHAPLCTVAPRLCRLAGIEPEYYENLREQFDCLNAVRYRVDAYPWRVARARDRWTRWLLTEAPPGKLVVVCLGRRASTAVGLKPDRSWGTWLEAGLLEVTVIPHPSGLCRSYNDPAMHDLARRVLREARDRAREDC